MCYLHVFCFPSPGWDREGEGESGEATENYKQDALQQQGDERSAQQPWGHDEDVDDSPGSTVAGRRFPGDGGN